MLRRLLRYNLTKGIPFLGVFPEPYLRRAAYDSPMHSYVQSYKVLSMVMVLNWLISMAPELIILSSTGYFTALCEKVEHFHFFFVHDSVNNPITVLLKRLN